MLDKETSAFETLYQKLLSKESISYPLPFPKHRFFLHLIQKHQLLLHGSPQVGIQTLQPHHARCFSKNFGNMNGVYASSNAITPIMFAIAVGNIKMYYDIIDDGADADPQKYRFDFSVFGTGNFNFGEGMVYILPRVNFLQGIDENGKAINEWISFTPVCALASVPVEKSDFPFQVSVS